MHLGAMPTVCWIRKELMVIVAHFSAKPVCSQCHICFWHVYTRQELSGVSLTTALWMFLARSLLDGCTLCKLHNKIPRLSVTLLPLVLLALLQACSAVLCFISGLDLASRGSSCLAHVHMGEKQGLPWDLELSWRRIWSQQVEYENK